MFDEVFEIRVIGECFGIKSWYVLRSMVFYCFIDFYYKIFFFKYFDCVLRF